MSTRKTPSDSSAEKKRPPWSYSRPVPSKPPIMSPSELKSLQEEEDSTGAGRGGVGIGGSSSGKASNGGGGSGAAKIVRPVVHQYDELSSSYQNQRRAALHAEEFLKRSYYQDLQQSSSFPTSHHRRASALGGGGGAKGADASSLVIPSSNRFEGGSLGRRDSLATSNMKTHLSAALLSQQQMNAKGPGGLGMMSMMTGDGQGSSKDSQNFVATFVNRVDYDTFQSSLQPTDDQDSFADAQGRAGNVSSTWGTVSSSSLGGNTPGSPLGKPQSGDKLQLRPTNSFRCVDKEFRGHVPPEEVQSNLLWSERYSEETIAREKLLYNFVIAEMEGNPHMLATKQGKQICDAMRSSDSMSASQGRNRTGGGLGYTEDDQGEGLEGEEGEREFGVFSSQRDTSQQLSLPPQELKIQVRYLLRLLGNDKRFMRIPLLDNGLSSPSRDQRSASPTASTSSYNEGRAQQTMSSTGASSGGQKNMASDPLASKFNTQRKKGGVPSSGYMSAGYTAGMKEGERNALLPSTRAEPGIPPSTTASTPSFASPSAGGASSRGGAFVPRSPTNVRPASAATTSSSNNTTNNSKHSSSPSKVRPPRHIKRQEKVMFRAVPFIISEKYEQTLFEALKADPLPSAAHVVEWVRTVVIQLQELHAMGVAHNAVNPKRIVLCDRDSVKRLPHYSILQQFIESTSKEAKAERSEQKEKKLKKEVAPVRRPRLLSALFNQLGKDGLPRSPTSAKRASKDGEGSSEDTESEEEEAVGPAEAKPSDSLALVNELVAAKRHSATYGNRRTSPHGSRSSQCSSNSFAAAIMNGPGRMIGKLRDLSCATIFAIDKVPSITRSTLLSQRSDPRNSALHRLPRYLPGSMDEYALPPEWLPVSLRPAAHGGPGSKGSLVRHPSDRLLRGESFLLDDGGPSLLSAALGANQEKPRKEGKGAKSVGFSSPREKKEGGKGTAASGGAGKGVSFTGLTGASSSQLQLSGISNVSSSPSMGNSSTTPQTEALSAFEDETPFDAVDSVHQRCKKIENPTEIIPTAAGDAFMLGKLLQFCFFGEHTSQATVDECFEEEEEEVGGYVSPFIARGGSGSGVEPDIQTPKVRAVRRLKKAISAVRFGNMIKHMAEQPEWNDALPDMELVGQRECLHVIAVLTHPIPKVREVAMEKVLLYPLFWSPSLKAEFVKLLAKYASAQKVASKELTAWMLHPLNWMRYVADWYDIVCHENTEGIRYDYESKRRDLLEFFMNVYDLLSSRDTRSICNGDARLFACHFLHERFPGLLASLIKKVLLSNRRDARRFRTMLFRKRENELGPGSEAVSPIIIRFVTEVVLPKEDNALEGLRPPPTRRTKNAFPWMDGGSGKGYNDDDDDDEEDLDVNEILAKNKSISLGTFGNMIDDYLRHGTAAQKSPLAGNRGKREYYEELVKRNAKHDETPSADVDIESQKKSNGDSYAQLEASLRGDREHALKSLWSNPFEEGGTSGDVPEVVSNEISPSGVDHMNPNNDDERKGDSSEFTIKVEESGGGGDNTPASAKKGSRGGDAGGRRLSSSSAKSGGGNTPKAPGRTPASLGLTPGNASLKEKNLTESPEASRRMSDSSKNSPTPRGGGGGSGKKDPQGSLSASSKLAPVNTLSATALTPQANTLSISSSASPMSGAAAVNYRRAHSDLPASGKGGGRRSSKTPEVVFLGGGSGVADESEGKDILESAFEAEGLVQPTRKRSILKVSTD